MQAEGQQRAEYEKVALGLLADWPPLMTSYVPRSIRQLHRLLKGMSIGMLTTQTSDGAAHTRPMMVHEVDDEGWLWFLTDRHSRRAWELIQNPQVTIAFQSSKGDRYVSLQGTAVVVRDDVKLEKMWKPSYRAWFPRGKQEVEIVLVAVRVARAEYWFVPQRRLARVAHAARAMLMGRRLDAGNHGVLDLYPVIV